MARKTKLTSELIDKVGAYIAGGAYDYIACEAVGICQKTFYSWLNDAEKPDADPLLVQFAEAVEEAKAKARVAAEVRVKNERPEVWLLRGPGRERPGRPGWSMESTVNVTPGDGKISLTWGEPDEAESDTDPTTTVAPDAAGSA